VAVMLANNRSSPLDPGRSSVTIQKVEVSALCIEKGSGPAAIFLGRLDPRRIGPCLD
jgi:hypothetical protein